MAIRTLAAAAELIAFTTPAFAQVANEAVVLDDIAMLSDTATFSSFAVGLTPIIIAGIIVAFVTVTEDGAVTVDTDV